MEYIFDEVLEIKNGKNQKTVENPKGKYPIYGSGGIMGYADNYICEADTVIIGRKGSINNPIYVSEPFWNVDTAFGLSAKRECLLPRYLFYFCKKFNFEKLNKTVTVPSLTKSDLLKIKIELPDISIQKKVVDRLSKIEAIIERRKQELLLLDELIKARFVEMFGSPVSNPMFWKKRTLKEVCIKLNDGTHFSPESFETGEYKYVTAKNIKVTGFDFTNITYVPEEVHRPIYERCNPELGDVLYIKDGATTGIAMVNTLEEEFTLLSSVALLKQNRTIMNGYFLTTLLNNEDMYMD
ncbi:MAG: restriction endonuclease subunit S, partial [Clostridium saudiense]|nr:restriction endonuclease subunit S [Clostridium saudiense]